MRLVIALDGIYVSEHFGKCNEYAVYDIAGGAVTSRTIVSNPGHQADFLPRYFAAMEADCIISGGIGESALDLLKELGVTSIVGIKGKAEQAVLDFLSGTLVPGENLCRRKRSECACQMSPI